MMTDTMAAQCCRSDPLSLRPTVIELREISHALRIHEVKLSPIDQTAVRKNIPSHPFVSSRQEDSVFRNLKHQKEEVSSADVLL